MTTVYRCFTCGEIHDGFTALTHSESCGPLFPHPRAIKVGDRVSLHHAKAKIRKIGSVVKVTPTRCVVEVRYVGEGTTLTRTTRKLNDPDIRFVS